MTEWNFVGLILSQNFRLNISLFTNIPLQKLKNTGEMLEHLTS